MATPNVKKAAAPAHPEPAHIEHHYSWAPPLLGLGALFLYIGFEFVTWNGIPIFPFLGIVGVLAAFWIWVKEDVVFWKNGHVDPGVLPGKHGIGWWGLMFFLGTEVMLFGGLFAYYFFGNAALPDVYDQAAKLPIGATSLFTAILVASSFTLHFGEKRLMKNDRKGFVMWLVITIVLGVVFLGGQVYEYSQLISQNHVISKDPFWAIFYMLTGTHGFHVFLGLALLGIVLARAFMGQFDRERHVAVEAFSIYWHFVDVVWVFLFTVVYVLPHYGVI